MGDSLTGEVASKKVTEAYKGRLSTDGNRTIERKSKIAGLTVRQTRRADTKVGSSDLLHTRGSGRAYRIKVTPGITG